MSEIHGTGPGRRFGVEAEFERIKRRVRVALGALMLVTLTGILGFVLIGGAQHGLVDAIYMTVITLSTVGFGEIVEMDGNAAGRLFTVALILGGMGIVAYTIPMLAALLIEGQLHNVFARRRMEKAIGGMSGHYIVCGDTPAARYVVEELLRTRRDVVVVGPREDLLAAEEWLADAPRVVGDPSHDDVLSGAGIDRAAGVVFAMREDKDNVIGVLTARRLAPNARIIAATEESDTESKLRSVGADAIVSPSRIGGLRMASELVRPTVVTFLDRMLREKGGTLRVEEVTVPDDAAVEGQTLDSLRVNDIRGALLLAVRHAKTREFAFKPSPDTPLEHGMTLVVMADAEGHELLKRRFKRATGVMLRPELPDA